MRYTVEELVYHIGQLQIKDLRYVIEAIRWFLGDDGASGAGIAVRPTSPFSPVLFDVFTEGMES